jgi:glutamate dehydrogenase
MNTGMVRSVPSAREARETQRAAVAERARELAGDDGAAALQFVNRYYAHVTADDLALSSADHLARAALAHYRLGAVRPPATPLVHVHNPTLESAGWDAPHTIVDIVNDDMPFLVDSITMALDRHDLGVHFVVHPVLEVRRDPAGTRADAGTLVRESWIHVEVDRETSPEILAAVCDDLDRALHDVRAATGDWLKMLATVDAVGDDLDEHPPPCDPDEFAEGRALLAWLADQHFTFLGYRTYDLERDDAGGDVLRAVPGSGLGILRNDTPTAASTAPRADHAADSFARLPAVVRAKARERTLLVLTKANTRSTIHRPTYLDYVGVKRYDALGNVIGEHRFLGLYTSSAYNASPIDVPVLRRKVAEVVSRSQFAPASHDFKDLVAILEGYPRDDLFQISADHLFDIAMGILSLQERRRVRLFVHREQYGRFVSCLVFLPRDRYTTPVRERVAKVLIDAFGATSYEWNTRLSASVLARLHLVLRVDPTVALDRAVEPAELEAAVANAARAWADDLQDTLISARGEEEGLDLLRTWNRAFPASYQEDFPARDALVDIGELTAIGSEGAPRLAVGLAGDVDHLDLKVYGLGAQPSLSDVLPSLTNLGVIVDDEHPYQVAPVGMETRWIKHFRLRAPVEVPSGAYDRFEETFLAVLGDEAEDDPFNRLVLLAGLSWREIAVLRAYSRYLRQVGTPFSQTYIATTLAAHPDLAQRLVALFTARFDPARGVDVGQETDGGAIDSLVTDITDDLDAVTSLDEDRILRALLHLVLATLRTNWFQRGSDGRPRPCLVLKLDPALVPDLPLPRPMFELFVYSPRVEGVHLRAGRVARGGIRWSDRREDYRTEVLGLMKAQKVKNAVIVPSGAKGGFVVKRPPADPAELRAEVEACYRLFIAGLLDVTDNLLTDVSGATIAPPADVVRFDGDDHYLVVAADKGTASFSDVANEIACSRGFWLGDAFASGGSEGYDHKVMGITARGAWESVRRHFRHLALDPDRHDFTVVGIGDMSGDVFGNGMLLSHHIRLVAAFDHRHVFLDPDPDAERSWRERQRLFDLPRSSWADYETALLSPGGGVYPRTLKAITITDEVRARLAIDPAIRSCTPNDLIRLILRAPVDLLYNGGIGTYVKASDETNAEVGDKATDPVRIDGAELRCRAVGEGGNLGFTQDGRVEYAMHGGLINTDAIDNSAGVDTSDHEVNIKILLDASVRAGDLTSDQRNALLHSMTGEVAALVLRDNYRQNRALDNAKAQSPEMEDVHARFMRALEQQKQLDRGVERLPDDETLANRRNAGLGLAVPELAVLLAYAKITLEEDLLRSPLPDDADFVTELVRYFPTPLREQFLARLRTHPLRREIVATGLVNGLVNRAGLTFAFRLGEETGATGPDIVRAHEAARSIFGQEALWRDIEALDETIDVDVQTTLYLESRKLVERASRWLLRHRARPLAVGPTVEFFAPPTARLTASLPASARGTEKEHIERTTAELAASGVPAELATRIAALELMASALDATELADAHHIDVERVGDLFCVVGDRLRLDWLWDRILELPRTDRWDALARNALREDLDAEHRAIVDAILRTSPVDAGTDAAFDRWAAARQTAVDRTLALLADIAARGVFDLATLSVALRELRALA